MTKSDRAASIFKEGFNCAQSVFAVFGPELGLEQGTAAKIATPFGGGMARRGQTCGAVTGAFMAVGLKWGNSRAADKEIKEQTYEVVREFVRRFEARHGSIVCRELLGCDISTHEGHERAKEQNLFDTVCSKLVRDSVEMLEEMLSK